MSMVGTQSGYVSNFPRGDKDDSGCAVNRPEPALVASRESLWSDDPAGVVCWLVNGCHEFPSPDEGGAARRGHTRARS